MSEPSPGTLLHSAFHRFVPLSDPVAAADALRALARDLTGSIVVAHEGINGTVAGAVGSTTLSLANRAASRAGANSRNTRITLPADDRRPAPA